MVQLYTAAAATRAHFGSSAPLLWVHTVKFPGSWWGGNAGIPRQKRMLTPDALFSEGVNGEGRENHYYSQGFFAVSPSPSFVFCASVPAYLQPPPVPPSLRKCPQVSPTTAYQSPTDPVALVCAHLLIESVTRETPLAPRCRRIPSATERRDQLPRHHITPAAIHARRSALRLSTFVHIKKHKQTTQQTHTRSEKRKSASTPTLPTTQPAPDR